MQRPILTVSEITRYIKEILSNNIILGNVLVKGEISNYKSHYSGHCYFTLKDEFSTIKCVMFRSSSINMKFEPENGMKVIVQGRVSVYERDGCYQVYVDEMQPDGIGALHLAFEQLKSKLEREGFFDSERKREIPFLPKSIGIVTSPTGAALRDMLNILSRRFCNINVTIFPVQVQGEGAAQQIAFAIDELNRQQKVDVIIIGRGGGSIEELWAFNEEVLARSIFASKIPIISAVGHETDFTIADFVADLRAPTPSAAAELAVPCKSDLDLTVRSYKSRLIYSIQNKLDLNRSHLDRLINSGVFKQPLDNIYQYRLHIDSLNKHMVKDIKYLVDNNKNKVFNLIDKLSVLSPLNLLKRGYSITSNENNEVIKSVNSLKEGSKITVQYFDGSAECTVINAVKRGETCE